MRRGLVTRRSGKSHIVIMRATLRTLDCGTQSITGHASLPSTIRSAEPGTQRFVDVAIRTAAPCGALRTDFLPWLVSFYSDRPCSIRTYDRQRATASCAMHRQFSFFVRLRRCFSVPTFLSRSASRAAVAARAASRARERSPAARRKAQLGREPAACASTAQPIRKTVGIRNGLAKRGDRPARFSSRRLVGSPRAGQPDRLLPDRRRGTRPGRG